MDTNFNYLVDNKNIDEVIQGVRKIATDNFREAIPVLLTLLENTEDDKVRNEVALSLSDLKEQRAVDLIIKLIKSSKTEGNRGTLIYALEELDYSQHLSFIFSLLLTGNFEVSRNAYCLIEKALAKNNDDLNLIKEQIPLLIEKIQSLQNEIDFYISTLGLLSM